jgi:uncharacterized protein (DUF849 family)
LASQRTADRLHAAIAQAVYAATDIENFNSEEVRTATVISVRGDPRWRSIRRSKTGREEAFHNRQRGTWFMSRKVIITCAVTGAIHTPSMSPYLPVTPDEIADAAIGAADAGAAIVHLHARDPKTGQPDQTPEAFAPFLKVIKQHSGCVINLTTGGAPTMTVAERVKPAAVYQPEVASLNMGSMNFGLFRMLDRFKEFKHPWEKAYLQKKDILFRNTFEDIEFILRTLAESGTRFEFECYDTAHLHNLRYFFDEGLVKAPLFIQTVFGLQGGIGPHPDELMHMKRTADRQLAAPGAEGRPPIV